MVVEYKQDMPPPGGYSRVQWERVPYLKAWSGKKTFAIMGVVSAFGWALAYYDIHMKKKHNLQFNDMRIAIEPLLLAEQHRRFLRQLRANRDEENELMKDVPGWQTGTLYGKPVFHNQANRWPRIHYHEFYMHQPYSVLMRQQFDENYR